MYLLTKNAILKLKIEQKILENTVNCRSISEKKVHPNSPDKNSEQNFGPIDWSFMDNSCIFLYISTLSMGICKNYP